VSNLKNHETIYFCIYEPNQPYRGVRGKGKVTVHGNVDYNVPIEEKIVVKYLRDIENQGAKMLMDVSRSGNAVIIEITPIYFSTWDYTKGSDGLV
jgi:hypothetical protein